MDQFFLVHKESGLTSSQVVQKLKRKLGLKKLGHTGTLDKFAEGLLIFPAGKACSFASLFLEMNKSYEATLCLGKSTDSGDPEGNTLEIRSQDEVLEVWNRDWKGGENLRQAILNLKNLKEQEAPVISALKFQGKRLSDLHRAGKPTPPKIRPIHVNWVEILEFNPQEVKFELEVSSGTYIRKVAMDLGKELNFPISLKKLVRKSIGNFSLDQAKTWETIESEDGKEILDMLEFPRIEVGEESLSWVKSGRKHELGDLNAISGENFFLVDQDQKILAWCRKKNNQEWQYMRVFL